MRQGLGQSLPICEIQRTAASPISSLSPILRRARSIPSVVIFSAKIPGWNPDLHSGEGNSDPFAVPDGVAIARGQREKVIWFIKAPVANQTYPAPWTADRDWGVVKAKVTASIHDPATHPNDGAPSGGPLKVQLVRITADESQRDNMMPSDDRLRVEAGTHKDAQFVEDFLITEVLDGEQVVPKMVTVNGATDVVVTLVLDPK